MAWTYSIDYEIRDDEGNSHYGSTTVAAETCYDALVAFMERNPGSDVREMRRTWHD